MKLRTAAGEFVIIVLGVLTALLGESVASSYRDSLSADQYRLRLVEDLRADADEFRHTAGLYTRSISSGQRVLGWLGGEDRTASATDLLVHVLNAQDLWPPQPRTDTWDDLEATGRLSLLPEADRIALAEYYKVLAQWAQFYELPVGFRQAVRRIVPPAAFQRHGGCAWNVPNDLKELPAGACNDDFGPDPGGLLAQLKAVPGIGGHLNERLVAADVAVGLMRMSADSAEAVANGLDRRLRGGVRSNKRLLRSR